MVAPRVPPFNAVDSVLSRRGEGGTMGRVLRTTLLSLVPNAVLYHIIFASRRHFFDLCVP